MNPSSPTRSNSARIRKSAPPRKKACQNCTRSKVRCNLGKPSCTRCKTQGRPCLYPGGRDDSIEATTTTATTADGDVFDAVGSDFADATNSGTGSSSGGTIAGSTFTPSPVTKISTATESLQEETVPTSSIHEEEERVHRPSWDILVPHLNFSDLDLVPVNDAESIRDRWLESFLASPGQVLKTLHPFTVHYISCVLKTYPRRMLEDGGIPPFVHPMQVERKEGAPLALANCYSLVRMWMNRVPGSERMVIATVQGEMERLVNEPNTSSKDIDLLSSFQAYLIYMILIYFIPLSDKSNDSKNNNSNSTDPILLHPADPTSIVNLQELAFRTTKNGLFCTQELIRTTGRPTWESWIVASAKRRSIFAMYLFTSVFNAERSLPNFLSAEIQDVFVPEGRELWAAKERRLWEREYDKHVAFWGEEGMLVISELWKSAQTGSKRRRDRVEKWVRGVDDFGMMLFGVCVHIHGL